MVLVLKMYDYEDYENELAREQWLSDRDDYLVEQADNEWYDRRYYSDDET